jgi:multiple sugar transport system ATP-binding protein
MNLIEARLLAGDNSLEAHFGEHRLTCPSSVPALSDYVGKTIVLGLRPEHFEDASFNLGVPAEQRLNVTVDVRESLGSEVQLLFPIDAVPISPQLFSDSASDSTTGDDRSFTGAAMFVARVHPESKVRPGESVELTVDVQSLHFFDRATGLAISGLR